MTTKEKKAGGETLLNFILIVYYVMLCYHVWKAIENNDTPFAMWFWHKFAQACYFLGRHFGTAGMLAEIEYWKAVNNVGS